MDHLYATFETVPAAAMAVGVLIDRGVLPTDLSILTREDPPKTTDLYDIHDQGAHGVHLTEAPPIAENDGKQASIGFSAGALAVLTAVAVPGIGLAFGTGVMAMTLAGIAGASAVGAGAWSLSGYIIERGVGAEQAKEVTDIVESGGALVSVAIPNAQIETDHLGDLMTSYGGKLFFPTGMDKRQPYNV